MKRILIACEFSGIVREAFRNLGYDAWSCDLLDSEDNSVYHYKCDVREIIDNGWDMMLAFPPCTYLCSSGARWWKYRKKEQMEAIEFFMFFAKANIDRVAIENPVGIISTVWRKPDQYIQPWQFGHGETKKTGLWLKNLPLLKPTNIVNEREGRIYKMSQTKDRWKNRSRTYKGIAEAMAQQWGCLL